MTPQPGNWRNLAEQASKENDPKTLMSLVHELNRVLEQNEMSSRERLTQAHRLVTRAHRCSPDES